MTPNDIQRIANAAARRAGYSRATAVVTDKRRRYGAKVVKRIAPGKGRRAVVIVAVPAAWFQPVTLGKPTVQVTRTLPAKSDWRRLQHYNRLIRFNGHRFSYRVAYRDDPGNGTLSFLQRCVGDGTLNLDLSKVKRPLETDRELQKLLMSPLECG